MYLRAQTLDPEYLDSNPSSPIYEHWDPGKMNGNVWSAGSASDVRILGKVTSVIRRQ